MSERYPDESRTKLTNGSQLKVREIIFTPRQSQVILEVWQGKSNRDIAEHLSIAEKTVKFHITTIFKLLHVKSRAQLICLLYQEKPTFGIITTTVRRY
jgi:DNA-binding NarL/FixJ family response regulator